MVRTTIYAIYATDGGGTKIIIYHRLGLKYLRELLLFDGLPSVDRDLLSFPKGDFDVLHQSALRSMWTALYVLPNVTGPE